MHVSNQLHAPVVLPPGNEPTVPIDLRMCWPRGQSGLGGEIDGRISEWVFQKLGVMYWVRLGTAGQNLCADCNEISGPIK
jgi:hypothetical protein